jgi:hypothetical protein
VPQVAVVLVIVVSLAAGGWTFAWSLRRRLAGRPGGFEALVDRGGGDLVGPLVQGLVAWAAAAAVAGVAAAVLIG